MSRLGNGLYRQFGAIWMIVDFYSNSYRFRLINMSCDPNYVFSIDGHNFTVVEVDGISTQAVVADSVHIFASKQLGISFY